MAKIINIFNYKKEREARERARQKARNQRRIDEKEKTRQQIMAVLASFEEDWASEK